MSHCIECGTKLKPDDEFCPECGAEAVHKAPEEKKDSGGGSWFSVLMLALVVMMLISAVVFFIAIFAYSRGDLDRPLPVGAIRTQENRCLFDAEFTCLHSVVHDNVIVLSLRNDKRRPIIIEHITTDLCEGTDINQELIAGEKANILMKCGYGSLGQYAEHQATILYTDSGGMPARVDGLITGIVQMELRAAEE